MALRISETRTNSFLRCDRDESPGPILTASQVILIQSEVVGEEKVSMPSDSAAFWRGESAKVALERFVRFLGFSSLLQML